ncbi:MAG: hypothetical protein HC877_16615 [Thioploca sp.]|nr:hypothetical protein [Thioploca sp.]
MSTFLPKTLLLTALYCGQAVLANGGFYQDGGSSLRPLVNLQMQVIEEKLLIHPMPTPMCYHLNFRGQTLHARNLAPTDAALPLKAEEFAVVADVPTPCSLGVALRRDRLLSLWQAQVEYQVEALADQDAVLMGFPLPTWEAIYYLNPAKERATLPTPAAANFRIFIDGKLVDNPRLAWLETPRLKDIAPSKTLGFTWRASFKQGRKYTLRAEYDFGARDGSDFYPGREYREGEDLPWFLTSPEPKEVVSHQAVSLRYYLSPLRTWGAHPPTRITIEVRRPPDVTSAYLLPLMAKPVCVDADSLHYEYRDAYPDSELVISIPQWTDSDDHLHTTAGYWPTTPEQWRRWRKNLGESAIIACAQRDFIPAPEGMTCAEQCPSETIEPSIMLPRFEDFPAVERYTGPIAAPKLKSHPKAWEYRTRLREAAADGVNFAGRYILASWGCGSSCRDSWIIDAKTGKVYSNPFIYGITSYPPFNEFNYVGGHPEGLNWGVDFRSDSRLLLITGTPEHLGVSMKTLSALLWDGHAVKPLYIAYGAPYGARDRLMEHRMKHEID